MCDDEAPSARLASILDNIEAVLNEEPPAASVPEGVTDLSKRRADAEKIARFLIDTFGSDALARAQMMEGRSIKPAFAKAVRMAVERLVSVLPPAKA